MQDMIVPEQDVLRGAISREHRIGRAQKVNPDRQHQPNEGAYPHHGRLDRAVKTTIGGAKRDMFHNLWGYQS